MKPWKDLIQNVPSNSRDYFTIKDCLSLLKDFPLSEEDVMFMEKTAEKALNSGNLGLDQFIDEGGLDMLLIMLANYLNDQEDC